MNVIHQDECAMTDSWGDAPPQNPSPPTPSRRLPPAPPDHPKTNLVFVLGLLSLLFGPLGLILGPLAASMGIYASRQTKNGRFRETGLLTAGKVMGIIGAVMGMFFACLFGLYVGLIYYVFSFAAKETARSRLKIQMNSPSVMTTTPGGVNIQKFPPVKPKPAAPATPDIETDIDADIEEDNVDADNFDKPLIEKEPALKEAPVKPAPTPTPPTPPPPPPKEAPEF
jgi:hypothetical protein